MLISLDSYLFALRSLYAFFLFITSLYQNTSKFYPILTIKPSNTFKLT